MAGWVKFPMDRPRAVLWEASLETILAVENNKFVCVNSGIQHTFGSPVKLTGWHHVAATCDGKQMSLFIDGQAQGHVPASIHGEAITIGNGTNPWNGKGTKPWDNVRGLESQSGSVDDMFFFDRALEAHEIVKLGAVHIPPPPAPQVTPAK